jgi:S-adenosylmethionine/arginine decarboxylase-like enzyme
MNPKLVHKHLLVRAEVNSPPLYSYSSDRLNAEISNLVKHIDMEIMSGPHSAYCVEPGNIGWSSTAIITTSSITFHSWTELNLIQLDVYSCKNFKIKDVFMWLAQFDIEKLDYKYLDREHGFKTLADQELNHWDNKQYNLGWKDEVLYE